MASVAKKFVELITSDVTTPSAYTGTVTQVGVGTFQVLLDGADEPTTCTTEVKAIQGDRVSVEVRNHVATVRGNITNPVTDDSTATSALNIAQAVEQETNAALTEIRADVTAAEEALGGIQEDLAEADAAITQIQGDVQAANQAATQAASDAQAASQAATQAATDAQAANRHATDALSQLGVVESVVDTLTWISEHGGYEPTADEAVERGKTYYELVDGAYVAVADPVDADLASYYELVIDEALTSYVSSHLALTDDGLWVMSDASGYRVLLSSEGMSVVDPDGATVATYGESISFDAARPQRIGGADAYVEWDGDALAVVASTLTIAGVAAATQDDLGAASDALGEAIGEVGDVADAASAALAVLGDYIRVTTSPAALELGAEGGTKATLTADSLDFSAGEDAQVVASIGVDEDGEGRLMGTRATFTQDVSVGEATEDTGGYWRWEQRSNGNLCLKWIGAD